MFFAQKPPNFFYKNGHSKRNAGYFGLISPDDHLHICFSDQQDFTGSTLVPYSLNFEVLCFLLAGGKKFCQNPGPAPNQSYSSVFINTPLDKIM